MSTPTIAGNPAPQVSRPLYYHSDGTSNGGSQVVDGTFDALRCCRQGYQLMTPRRPSQRDRMKGLLAAPCGVKDCRDGKNRRQGFHKAGWRKIDLDEARAIAPDEAAMYAEIKNGNGLVVRLVWGGQPGLFVPRISGIEVV